MRYKITVVAALAVLAIALACPAADYYHLRDHVTTKSGYAASGVYVYIYTPNTTTPVTAYTDLAGSTAATFPLTTDSNGMFECYIADGNYDITHVHSGWNIDTTWDNYMVGIVTGVDSLGSVTCVDTLKGCSDDTLHIRASDGARHGVLQTNQLVLENAWGHDGDKAAITFGPYASGTDNINARIYLPYYGVFYMTRPGYNHRVPQMDGTTYTGHMSLGIGGTEGVATNWQFWEDVFLTWTHPRADSVAATGGRYLDRPVIEFGRRLTTDGGPPDAAYSGADTLRCDAYQSLNIRNDRGNRVRWKWGKAQGDTCVGVLAGPYGAPDYGIRLQTDLPDSNGTNGERTAVQIRWWMTPGSNEVENASSSFLTILEHDTENYVFTRDGLELRPSKEGSINKALKFYGTGGAYSKMKMQDDETNFALYAHNRLFRVYDYDGSDDARLKVAQVYTDTLKAKSDSTLYIHASDMKDNATLNVNRTACDTLKPRTGTTAYIRAADGQNDATLEVDNITLSGDVEVSGELKGARCLLGIGRALTDQTTDQWLRGNGDWGFSTNRGYVMNRAGSIVGATLLYSVDSITATPTFALEIRKNNTEVYEVSDTVTETGMASVYGTQARGIDVFAAGDLISALIDIDGTIQYDGFGGYIEVQFDD